MNDQSKKQSDQKQKIERRPVIKASLGFVFGAMVGLIIGNMLGSQSLGLIFGAGMGLIFGAMLDLCWLLGSSVRFFGDFMQKFSQPISHFPSRVGSVHFSK